MPNNLLSEKDIRAAKKNLNIYVKNLDTLRWEYLRESKDYRNDWELCREEADRHNLDEYDQVKGYECSECENPVCSDECEYSAPPGQTLLIYTPATINSFYLNLKKDSILKKTWLRYGSNVIANPDWSYEEVIKNIPIVDGEKLVFYNMWELSIEEGIHKNVKYSTSPLVNLTVNITLPLELLAKQFREFISSKKSEFNKLDKNKVISKKWVLPKNVHFDTLDVALMHYRMHVHDKMSLNEIAKSLALDFIGGGTIHKDDDPKSRFFSLVKKNISKAREVIKNVEKGIFP